MLFLIIRHQFIVYLGSLWRQKEKSNLYLKKLRIQWMSIGGANFRLLIQPHMNLWPKSNPFRRGSSQRPKKSKKNRENMKKRKKNSSLCNKFWRGNPQLNNKKCCLFIKTICNRKPVKLRLWRRKSKTISKQWVSSPLNLKG